MSEKTRTITDWAMVGAAIAVLAILFYYVSINEKRAGQDALIMNLLEATNTLVITVDEKSVIKEVSGANFLQYTSNELVGKNLSSIMPPSIGARHDARVPLALSGPSHVNIMACQLIDLNGAARDVSVRVFSNQTGRVAVALINLADDVTPKNVAIGSPLQTEDASSY